MVMQRRILKHLTDHNILSTEQYDFRLGLKVDNATYKLTTKILKGKLEGRRPQGRPRHRWVDNIRMDLQEVGCGYVDWIGLAQDRDRWWKLVSAVMNLRVQ